MEANWRWWNPSHPQTVKIAVGLGYLNAVFSLFSLGQTQQAFANLLGIGVLGVVLALARLVLGAGAAIGMANDSKLWYRIAVVLGVLALVLPVIVVIGSPVALLNPAFLLQLVWPVAFLVALLHPMTRDYVKVWFH